VLFAVSRVDASEPDTLNLIPRLLAKSERIETHGFRVTRTKSQWVITYCPDNTCGVFRAPLKTPREAIGDFALLWLYYASGYIYLENFESDAEALVASTLERYSMKCPPSSEEATASCVLTSLAKQHNIRLAFRRSDEGATGEWKVALTEELSPEAISQTKLWQRNEWEKSKEPWLLNK
jgi:hypothetical protein